jgi:Cu/Ag efflux pump CusA
MALGALFVVAILVALLRSPRLAVISLSALPLSIAAAIAVLLSLGTTLNGMILGGLAIAVGEVVDDAIVDVENIWRRLRENRTLHVPRSALEVIHDASREVRGTVVYASSIVVAVLTPIMVLGGLTGRIFSPLAETYALAVAASLAVALTVTPALAALLLPRLSDRAPSPTRLSRWLTRTYDRALDMVRRAPGRVVAIAAVLGLGALAAAPFIGGAFLPELREGVLIAAVTAPAGTSLEETMRLAERIDTTLRTETGVRHVAARAGRASLDEDAAPVNRLEIDLVLPEDAEPEEIASEISARLADIPGVRFGVEGFLGERINELLSGERTPIALKLRGDDLDALREAASSIVRGMEGIEEIRDVRASGLSDVPTTDIRTDDRRLAIHGLSRTELVDTVAAYHQGLEVASVATPGGFFAPVVLTGAARGASARRFADAPVSTASAVLPLSRFAAIVHGAEPPVIDHEAGQRLLTVTATTRPGDTSVAAERAEAMMREVELPPGVSFELAGQAVERTAASTRLVLTVALVLVAVFGFLWMAFHSLVDAGVVLLGLPLGLVGGVVAALLIPEGLSMAGLVGFVALFGIISRNGIMLVAHKNHIVRESGGQLTEEIVLAAARERLLPIAMTAATAFFGLLPLAASLGAPGSELEAPMAVVVCAGLVTSTALNLLAVPAFYLWRAGRGQESNPPEEVTR